MRVRSVLVAVLVSVAAAPLVTQATLYKWVDDQGVVNYSDAPPSGQKNATPLDESTSSLSVFPGMSKDELARAREHDAQYRAQQLERELAELRARTYMPAPPPPFDTQQLAYEPAFVPLVVTRRI